MKFPRIFSFVFSAILIAGCSGSSGGSGATVDTTAPTVPTGLSATAVNESEINLVWTASTDAVGVAGYRVYLDSDYATPLGTVTTVSFSVSGLMPDTLYSFEVRAFDAAGNESALSNAATATTLTAPVAPLAGDDSATVAVSEIVIVDVLSNDTDDGTLDPASVVPTNPSAGTLGVDSATGAITYTHDGSAPGMDSFTYTVNDDIGLTSNIATVTITVEAAPPAIPAAGLVLHLEADTGVASTGSTVTGWADQSSQGNDLVGAGDPQLLNGALNGQPVIDFDGNGDKLERTTTLNGLPAGGADRTVYIVANYRGTGFGGFAYGTGFGPPNTCNQTFGLVVNLQGRLTVQGWCDDFDSGNAGTGQGWLVQSALISAGEMSHFLNGNLIDTQVHSYNTVLSNLVLGAEIDNDPFIDLQVAAVIVYDRALNAAEQTEVQDYLQTKYLNGGGGNQPVAPVLSAIGDQTVDEGATLTLNLSATDGDASDTLSFSVVPALPYGIFTDNGNRSATWVLTPGPGDASITAVTITVTDNGTPSLLDAETFNLTVKDPNATSVTGVVRNAATMLPIENAVVALQTTATKMTTAADGSFTFSMSGGSYVTIVGASEGYYSASKTATAPASNIEILLDPVVIGTNAAYSFTEPSTCGVCHPNQENEWDNSVMANAGVNTWVHDIYDGNGTPGGMGGFVYTRDSAYAGSSPDSECAACHQPESWVAAGYSGRMQGPDDAGYPSAASAHGISCETCHKIANVDTQKIDFPGIFPGAVTFNLPDSGTQVQYGGLADVDFNSPGTMEPSYQPQLEAEVCGVCHQDKNDINEDHTFAGITSEPTYTEWAESPYGMENSGLYQSCIDCHMPPTGETQFCTVSSLDRDPSAIRSHAIKGTTPSYLDNAVELSMQTQLVGNELQVDVTIDNSLTGHHVPTGVTVRNMILLIEAWQDGEDPLVNPLVYTSSQTIHDLGGIGDPAQGYYAGLPGKFYAKVNHDVNLQGPTFFTDATGIIFDNRIPALGTDATSYTFSMPNGTGTIHVRARLIYRRAFRFLVDAKGWTEDGRGNPLEDVAGPDYGHLMEITTTDVSY
jgi:chitodextrinase